MVAWIERNLAGCGDEDREGWCLAAADGHRDRLGGCDNGIDASGRQWICLTQQKPDWQIGACNVSGDIDGAGCTEVHGRNREHSDVGVIGHIDNPKVRCGERDQVRYRIGCCGQQQRI